MKRQWQQLILACMISSLTAVGNSYAFDKPVTLTDQGSFMAGGTVVTATGTYGTNQDPRNLQGNTLHGDHAYVFYQVPDKARPYGMVFLHGYGQSGKTWETTPDGRDGFQNIFLEKHYRTYVVDEPRRGRAGQSTVPATLTATPQDQLWFDNFRMGQYPSYYKGVATPQDKASEEQFFRQMTPDTGAFDEKVVADAMVAVFDKVGDNVLVTHSAGGGPGWLTAIRSPHVKAVIAMEPGTFPFPEGQVPATEVTTSPFPARPQTVSMEEFMKLTKIPILVYFGDFIPTDMTENWGLDNWRVRLNLARQWETLVNRYGGQVQVIYLPDIGIRGNTHFLMADKNNRQIANHMARWIEATVR